MKLINLALTDMSKILTGAQIRIFELATNLGGVFIHGIRKHRFPNYIKALPSLFTADNVLIYEYNLRFPDLPLINILKHHSQILFDVADVPHLQAIYSGLSKVIDRKLEENFFKLFNVADVLLFAGRWDRLLGSNCLCKKNVLMVPNAANPKFFIPSPLPRGKHKTVLYVGGYAPARGIDILIDAFQLVREKNRDAVLKLVGFNMPTWLNGKGLIIERNKFYKDIPSIVSDSYLCVIPHKKNPYMDNALPIKLYEAMAASRPVVVTNCLEMARLVNEEKCGVVTKCDAKSLSEGIEYLISNPAIAEEMGFRGREAIEKRHSWKHRAETIRKCLRTH